MATKFEEIFITALTANGIPTNESIKIVMDICREHAREELVIPKKPACLYQARNEMIIQMQGSLEEIADMAGLSERQVRRILKDGN